MCVSHTLFNIVNNITNFYSKQQQLYPMRCTTVAPVEAGSHVGCQRQLPGTVTVADRDCAADGERVAADIEAEDYHRR
jgi:hypothetical protein